MEDRKKSRFNIRNILSIFLMTAGLLLILIPILKTYLNTKRNDDIIEDFLNQSNSAVSDLDSLEEVEVESFHIPSQVPESPITEPVIDNPVNPTETPAPSETIAPPETTKKPKMTKEEIQKRTTGILIIPEIDVKMLIMDGTDDATLSVAAGRLTYTDNIDEIGNCVLAGHRSYTFGKYLNRLNELDIGDTITIQTKTKTLNYTIYKTHIIEPDDFSILNRNDTDKILTVFTCDPPGIGSHRLVVHAKQDE